MTPVPPLPPLPTFSGACRGQYEIFDAAETDAAARRRALDICGSCEALALCQRYAAAHRFPVGVVIAGHVTTRPTPKPKPPTAPKPPRAAKVKTNVDMARGQRRRRLQRLLAAAQPPR